MLTYKNLSSGSHSKFSIPIVKKEFESQINREYASYEAGEASLGFLPLLIDNRYLALCHKDGDMFVATVFDGPAMATIYFNDVKELLITIENNLQFKGPERMVYKTDCIENEFDVYQAGFYGFYFRKWHMVYAANYFNLWTVSPWLDIYGNLWSANDPERIWLMSNETNKFGQEGSVFYIKNNSLSPRQDVAYHNSKRNICIFGDTMFVNYKYYCRVSNILDVYKLVHDLKPKPYIFKRPTRLFKKIEVLRLANKHWDYFCEGYRKKLNSLKLVTSLEELIDIFGHHRVKQVYDLEGWTFQISKESDSSTTPRIKRRPIGHRKPRK